MKKVFVFSLLLITSQFVFAQVLQFSLVDVSNDKSIEGVEVFSHEAHDKISYTDQFGLVLFDTDHTDTLIFFKKNYQPLYIQVHHTNFDTSHTIVLKMTHTAGLSNHKVPTKFDKYQASHHHFAHDSLSNSSIKVTQYHPLAPLPKYNDKAFHIAKIGLDGHTHHKRSAYTKK
jgi:hypothetical protein